MSDTISSIAQVIDSLHSTPQYQNTGYSMVRVVDINNEFLSLKRCSKVDEDTYVKHNKNHHPQRGDIIITRVGSYGMVGYVDTDEKFCLGQNLSIIHPQNFEDGKFLYYYILSPFMQKIIYGNIGGSAYKCLGLEDIRKLPLKVKGLKRREIGEFLYRIDKKINTNNSIIEVLESMAKTLYDYWFVQFDFPDANGRPYKNNGGKMVWNEELGREIPAGWEVTRLKKYFDIGNGKDHSNLEDGVYPVYGSGGLMRRVNQILCDEESVLIPRKGTLNNIMHVSGGFWTVDTMYFTKMKMPNIINYVYQTVRLFDFEKLNTGSALPSMTASIIYSLQVPDAPTCLIEKYDAYASKFFSKINATEAENRELIGLRDFLLPMLMNGQITFRS